MSGRPAVLLGVGAALAAAAPATAAEHQIRARDTLTWSPARITIAAGDTVTWTFTGTRQAHNVRSGSANWTFASPIGSPAPSASYTFTADGRYDFFCQIHPTTMRGSVTVGAGAPPDPGADEPYPNETRAPGRYERRDRTGPRLSRLTVRRARGGARVRFRVSERSHVVVRARRGGRTVRRVAAEVGRGRRAVRLRGLRPGTYRIVAVARDWADNPSRTRRGRVVVP